MPYTPSSRSSSSTTSLLSTHPSSKDFSAAFAHLQSSYGYTGAVPTPIPTPISKHGTKNQSGAATSSASSTKDFASAFADLQSSYGYAGSVPTPITKKAPKTSKKT
ncbi:hypothetical protein C8F01DRAFT_1124916 [Mycena amicta]|nr:hypothetical protein C8F01DRAFT_1124916 [Mycena amicta]